MIKTLKDVEYEEYSKWFEKQFKAFNLEEYNSTSIIKELISMRNDPNIFDKTGLEVITFSEWKKKVK